jgi:geranylgeranyl diphosphate synthase, type II
MQPDLQAYISQRRSTVDAALQKIFPPASGHAAEIIKAMEYSIFAGGKRLRPILCIAAAEAVGGHSSDVMPVACALELIHTYSLIHDDLPAMDNDNLRRGKPTNHNVFGEALALLAGDGLLTEAFHLMASSGETKDKDARTLLRVISTVAEAAGYAGMVGGQVGDMHWQGKHADLDAVQFIHKHKTAALIQASVVSGAMMAGATDRQIGAMSLYGAKTGLAFQISDDLLDLEGDSRTLGKQVGADIRLGKATYPAVVGIDDSKRTQSKLIEDAVISLEGFDGRADPLRAIANYVIERKK